VNPAPPETAAAPTAGRPLPNFVGFVLTIAMVWLGGQFLTQGLSDQFLSVEPELAVLWRGDSADAVAALARQRLIGHDRDGAARLARRALRLAPLNASALTTYGVAQEQLGRPRPAAAAVALAGRLGWRDVVTQLWLFRDRLLAGDLASAFDHADAVMRRQDVVPRALLLALATAARDPRSAEVLNLHLAADPPWRLPFFVFLCAYAEPPETDVARALLLRLARGPAPPTNDELAVYLRRLVGEQRFNQAAEDWRRMTHGTGQVGYVQDGDFARPQGNTPFDWLYGDAIGWSAGLSGAPGRGGQALEIDYDGVSPPSPVRQMLVLPPGAYRLTARSFDEGASDPTPLSWRLVCATDGQTLAGVATPAGAGKWSTFGTIFSVPVAGCPAQWLELSASPGDMRADITVWYDDIAVAPLPGRAATAPDGG
jgi:hypothetical protein